MANWPTGANMQRIMHWDVEANLSGKSLEFPLKLQFIIHSSLASVSKLHANFLICNLQLSMLHLRTRSQHKGIFLATKVVKLDDPDCFKNLSSLSFPLNIPRSDENSIKQPSVICNAAVNVFLSFILTKMLWRLGRGSFAYPKFSEGLKTANSSKWTEFWFGRYFSRNTPGFYFRTFVFPCVH